MSTTTNVTWPQRMMPHLESLAAKMLKNRDFAYLKTVVDLMVGLNGPGWNQLADEHKERYLEQMKTDFHPRGMGDSQYGFDPDFSSICELIDLEYRALRRRL